MTLLAVRILSIAYPEDMLKQSSVKSGPSIREAQKRSTRRLLLDASWQLFAENGYTDTTIEQVARMAGASRATFYIHFDAKWKPVAELQETVLQPLATQYYRDLDTALDCDITQSRSQLRIWLSNALEFYEVNRVYVGIIQETLALEPQFAAEQPDTLDALTEAMPKYLSRYDKEARHEAKLRIKMLILQITAFTSDWVKGYYQVDREAVIDTLLDFWSAGLRLPMA